ILLVGDPHGKNGSLDFSYVVVDAQYLAVRRTPEFIARFVANQIGKIIYFRTQVYLACKSRYGDDRFTNLHWIVAQLYPKAVFGADIFEIFLSSAEPHEKLGKHNLGGI